MITASQNRRDELVAYASLICFVIGCVAALLLVRFLQPEQLFPFNPAIDTSFATGYTEAGFDAITEGMPAGEVIALIGEPLSKRDGPYGGTIWQYSADGAFRWWDFAWLVRDVYIDDFGKAWTTHKDVRYD
jgi:hypothetical protein